MAWQVQATPPENKWATGWDFKEGHFPRTVAYKKDAERLVREATQKGGTNVSMKPVKK